MVETETSKRVPATDESQSRGTSALESRAPSGNASVLTWLNLVCLDAPLVAASWQWLFARTFGVPVISANACALFLTAWLIYLVDRLGDSVALRPGMPVALAYLILNHRWSSLWRSLPIKELLIGYLFAAGTIASLAPRFPGVTAPFLIASFLFACLCALNCMCIARWECALDRAQNRSSLATAWPHLAGRVSVAAVALAVSALVSAIFYRADIALFLALGLSGLALMSLDLFGGRVPSDMRTACADLALLTPLLVGFVG
jgi:hypothetical protein